MIWADWVNQFSENIEVSTRTFDKKREFLRGLIDKVIVNSEFGLNRKEERVQNGHSFDIRFKLKIVNDKLTWNDEKNKKKGYIVEEGRNLYKTGLVDGVTAKAGRKFTKKKQ